MPRVYATLGPEKKSKLLVIPLRPVDFDKVKDVARALGQRHTEWARDAVLDALNGVNGQDHTAHLAPGD